MTKVLLVEDDSGIVKVLTELLKGRGYNILWAPTVERARDILGSRGVDIIVCDFHLPDGTAIDVKKIRDELPGVTQTPFVIMTAAAESETVVLAAENGIKHFLCKPVTRSLLVKTMAKAMANTNT